MGAHAMKVFVLPLLMAMLVVGPALAEQKQVVRDLGKCGSEATNAFGKHREEPAVDEGNGFVGFETEETDATGTKERYTLVNCATRSLVQVNAEYLLKDSSKGLPGHGDLFAFLDGLRKKKRIANEALFNTNAANAGYAVIKGKLAAIGAEKARRADCGCRLYYPETM
jgi:hypothetical protein